MAKNNFVMEVTLNQKLAKGIWKNIWYNPLRVKSFQPETLGRGSQLRKQTFGYSEKILCKIFENIQVYIFKVNQKEWCIAVLTQLFAVQCRSLHPTSK